MKRKRVMVTIIQFLLVGTFGFSLINYTQKEIQPTEVWKFKTDIAVNSEIALTDLESVNIPAKAVDEHYITNVDDIVGKFTTVDITNGQKVLDDLVYSKDEVDPFKSMDKTDLRKISLPINYEEAISGNIKKGDKVDLVYTGAGKKEDDEFRYSKIFLQGVYVWSINTDEGYQADDHSQLSKNSTIDEDGNTIDTTVSSDEATTITLAVTLDQAEEISARLKTGVVRVVGRFDESEDYNSAGFVLGDYSKIFTGSANAETYSNLVE